jgi:hypothetical protein
MNVFEEYVAYLKDNPQGYWFKRKLYGFGWMPATKRGWTVLGVYLLFVISLSVAAAEKISDSEAVIQVLLPVALATSMLIAIAYKTGEPLKWQWGKKHGER